jgi:hypothetical protein
MKRTLGVTALGLFLALSPALAGELFSTSFEEPPVGRFVRLKLGEIVWAAAGRSEITDRCHHSGKKSLHLFGGTENTVELTLGEGLRNARGLSLLAERWTGKAPFAFRVDARSEGEWTEVVDLTDVVKVGKRFRSHIVLRLPEGPIDRLRLVVTAPAEAGILIDDFVLLAEEPAQVTAIPKITGTPIRKLLESRALFVSGTEGTHTFRIPALLTAKSGYVIALCDARRKSSADLIWERNIDIAMRGSTDHGKTWGNARDITDDITLPA